MADLSGRRICVVYDCLYPQTVGGAERWYRRLSDQLAGAGAAVTYLTRQQWTRGDLPDTAFDVVAATGPIELYDELGHRRVGPTIRFGWGVLRYLLRHRRQFDAVHVANFPFFSMLAAWLALTGTGIPVIVDWHEVWTRTYWRDYCGRLVGAAGYLIQSLCARLSQHAYVFSAGNGELLVAAGAPCAPAALPGLLSTGRRVAVSSGGSRHSYVLFAGRHISDKGVDIIPDVFAAVRSTLPSLRLVIAGSGPLTASVRARVEALGLGDSVDFPGFVGDDAFEELIAGAECLLLPSRREGYGMIVAEATALGTPVVVARHPENRAVDLIEPMVNGLVADPPTTDSLAAAVVAAVTASDTLRYSTRRWAAINIPGHSLDRSVEQVVGDYRSRFVSLAITRAA